MSSDMDGFFFNNVTRIISSLVVKQADRVTDSLTIRNEVQSESEHEQNPAK